MQFMMMVKGDKDYEAGVPPREELAAAIGKLTHDLVQAGAVVQVGGLLPSSKGARVRVSRGRVTVIDGPFAEAKGIVGGYAILRAGSKQEAIELGRRFMSLHADVLGDSYEGELEIRQLDEYAG